MGVARAIIRGALLAGMVLLAGGGSAGHQSALSTPPATHVIRHAGVTMVVPVAWHLGKQVRITRVRAVGSELLPRVPAADAGRLHSNGRDLPLYRTITLRPDGNMVRGRMQELSTRGTLYTVLIAAPRSQGRTVRNALDSLHLPPLATATTAVRLMFRRSVWLASSPPYVLASNAHPHAGWEPFFLYKKTSDRGNHWTLINWTGRSPKAFPNRGGFPTMIFSTPLRGVVAEVTMRSRKLLVYQTHDGGSTWTINVLTPAHSVDPKMGTEISQPAPHVWTVMVQLTSGARETFTSYNAGRTWTPSVAGPSGESVSTALESALAVR